MASYTGTVVAGRGEDRKLGIPTANIEVGKFSDEVGIYAYKCRIDEAIYSGSTYLADN